MSDDAEAAVGDAFGTCGIINHHMFLKITECLRLTTLDILTNYISSCPPTPLPAHARTVIVDHPAC